LIEKQKLDNKLLGFKKEVFIKWVYKMAIRSKTVHKKIVLDETNKPVEVIIAYEEWQEIEQLLSIDGKGMSKDRLKVYAGKINLTEDPLNFQRRIRNEWR